MVALHSCALNLFPRQSGDERRNYDDHSRICKIISGLFQGLADYG